MTTQCKFCKIETQDPHHLMECEALVVHEVEIDKKLYIEIPMDESYYTVVHKDGTTSKVYYKR